jgi:hypothetical protein
MRVIAVFGIAGANGVAVTLDRDSLLVGYNSSRAVNLISWDAADTINTLSPAANSVDYSSRMIAVVSFADTWRFFPTPIPVNKGESLFVSFSTAATVLLGFDQPT